MEEKKEEKERKGVDESKVRGRGCAEEVEMTCGVGWG